MTDNVRRMIVNCLIPLKGWSLLTPNEMRDTVGDDARLCSLVPTVFTVSRLKRLYIMDRLDISEFEFLLDLVMRTDEP